MSGDTYLVGAWITGVIAFIVIWIYASASWGFLLGLMFGWVPALIGGSIIGLLWPLVVLLIVLLIIKLLS